MTTTRVRVRFYDSNPACIHNLENICIPGNYITETCYEDFDTYADALVEIKRRNKKHRDCKLCEKKGGWIKD